MNTLTAVFVGGGPRTVSILERIAANAGPAGEPVTLHLIDPYPVGGGHIWRRSQSPLLWMNSTTADVTMFTDESVSCTGPIVSGPSLFEWLRGPGRKDAGREAGLGPNDFASRELQSKYLTWVYRTTLDRLPIWIDVVEHRAAAVDVLDLPNGRQHVALADGTTITADVVVLAQGYLERSPDTAAEFLQKAAAAHGVSYTPPGHTADLDLEHLRAGEPVLVRGFGLAFIDLAVLVNEGRGGRFVDERTDLRYLPSGREPVLYVGSRRGVPYHAKLGYRRHAGPVTNRYLTVPVVDAMPGPVDFRTDLWPLVVKELTAAHYRELFVVHADRTRLRWPEFSAAMDESDVTSSQFAAIVERAVPDPADRFDLASIDRPFAGFAFGDHRIWEAALVDYIRADLSRRADEKHSADGAVFDALLGVYQVLAHAVVTGRLSAHDRIRELEGRFHGLFSFLASGPPPRRLRELLALHRAGLVRFIGPETRVTLDAERGQFVGSSPVVAGEIRTTALIDAFLPTIDVSASTDPIVTSLLERGELGAEDLRDAVGAPLGSGQLLADAGCRAVRADGSVHPRRFLLGPSVSGSAGSAGFARPGFNGAGFRQNDRVAQDLLASLQSETALRTDERSLSHAR